MFFSKNLYQAQREGDPDYDPGLVEQLQARTAFWHGTGRFQYRYGQDNDKNSGDPENVTTIDALERMVAEGVVPQRDLFHEKYGMDVNVSISLTRARMYASVYARFFMEEGASLDYEYGSSIRWGLLYSLRTIMLNLQDRALWETWFKEQYQRIREKGFVDGMKELAAIQSGEFADQNRWVRNATLKPTSLWRAFLTRQGSDIPKNYAVMIGVPEDLVDPLPAAHDYIRAYETRTVTPLQLQDCSHLEVPLRRIAETRLLLEGYGVQLPVIAIEDGDLNYTRRPLEELLRPDLS